MAAGTILIEVAGIGVACKDHISHTVCDAIFGIRGNIVYELVESVCSGLGGCVLLVYDGTESNKKFIVDCVSVPQEGTNNTMDAFDASRVEWRAQIGLSRLLGLGAVGDGRILVRV